MSKLRSILCIFGLILAAAASAQTTTTWKSNSDQRWSNSNNWSGSRPDKNNEVAGFGTGNQHAPRLNSNSYTVKGITFSPGAASYNVGDDNGARTLKIGNNSSGFIENLSGQDQLISIATLQFQSTGTISNNGAGNLTISSHLTGSNRNLIVDGTGDTYLTGGIATGSGSLTKQDAGTLHLSGSDTYTGGTTINGGSLLLDSSNVLADTGAVTVNGGGTFGLNGQSEYIAGLWGAGTVDFGGGQLTLGSGFSYFTGNFAGTGELVLGSGASLYLGADFNNANLNITLAGGSLYLGGHTLDIGSLNVTADSVIDFSSSADSQLAVDGVGFGGAGVALSVQNWTDAADYFFSTTAYAQGNAPLNQIQFQGWTTADTNWQPFDSEITPVPEPATYGALLLALGLVGTGLRCWRNRRRPAAVR